MGTKIDSSFATSCPNTYLDLFVESDPESPKDHKKIKSLVLALVVITILFSFFYFRSTYKYPVQEIHFSKRKDNIDAALYARCRPFVLYSQQKSGTHYLMEVVHHSPPYVNLVQEIFHNNKEAEKIRNQSSEVYHYVKHKFKGTKSFILQHNQAERFCPVWNYVKDRDYRVVLLVRDPFDAEFSTIFYQQEDSAHCVKDQACTVAESVTVQPAKFIYSFKKRYRHLQRQLRFVENNFEGKYLMIKYEELVRSPETEFKKLFEFLECPPLSPKELESNYVPKHKKKTVKESVLNYKELQSFVSKEGSKFLLDNEQLRFLKKKIKDELVTPGKYPLPSGNDAGYCQETFKKGH